MFTWSTVLMSLAAFLTFIFGLFVYLKNVHNSINRAYLALCFFLGAWVATNVFYQLTNVPDTALLLAQVSYFFAMGIFVSLYSFVLNFPKDDFTEQIRSQSKLKTGLVSLFYMIGIASLVVPGFVNKSIAIGLNNEKIISVGPGLILFDLLLISIFVIDFYILFRKYAHAKGISRQQLVYVFFGCFIASVFGIIFNLILPAINVTSLVWLGTFAPLIMLAFFAYSILTQRLFDIRVIIRRTVVFAGLSIFVLGAYVMLVFTGSMIFGGKGLDALTADTFLPSLIAAFAIAVGFDPLRHWLSSLTDKWLFKGEYTSQQVLTDLSRTVANAVNLAEAIKRMIEVVVKSMRLTKGIAFLVQPTEDKKGYEQKQVIVAGDRVQSAPSLEVNDPLIAFFMHDQKKAIHEFHNPVVAEELARKLEEHAIVPARQELTQKFLDRLAQLGAASALPLFISRQQPKPSVPGTPTKYESIETFIGVLVLGEKRSGDSFSDQDLNLLEIVATETANAVEKSRLFEEDQLKTEFVAVASHELLTPTAAIEGYLSMILDENKGKVDAEAHGYLTTVYQESKRLAGLVKDLLNVSRIERGKIVVKIQKVNLADSITSTLNGMAIQAKERNMTAQFTPPTAPLPMVNADPEKLTEVLINLIGNAIKYTPEGGHVSVVIEPKPNRLLISVADNGIGMKPEDMAHVFEKFFRGSNSDATAQTGTGLGLYITKNVINLMGGTIDVQSTLGKGSTFTFSLPIAK